MRSRRMAAFGMAQWADMTDMVNGTWLTLEQAREKHGIASACDRDAFESLRNELTSKAGTAEWLAEVRARRQLPHATEKLTNTRNATELMREAHRGAQRIVSMLPEDASPDAAEDGTRGRKRPLEGLRRANIQHAAAQCVLDAAQAVHKHGRWTRAEATRLEDAQRREIAAQSEVDTAQAVVDANPPTQADIHRENAVRVRPTIELMLRSPECIFSFKHTVPDSIHVGS